MRGGGRCEEHRAEAARATRKARTPAGAGGYGRQHRTRFRRGVLRKHPYCMCDLSDHDHGSGPCPRPSTDADHWPVDRRQLLRLGLDVNDPRYGRGLCHSCHSSATARNPRQRGGWNRRSGGET